jgi:hypothetical protein
MPPGRQSSTAALRCSSASGTLAFLQIKSGEVELNVAGAVGLRLTVRGNER